VSPGGPPTLFGLRQGSVVFCSENADHETWADWRSLGAPPEGVTTVRATALGGGGLVVFAIGADGRVSHRWRDRPHHEWHPWEDLGGRARSLSVTRSPKGGLAIFAVADDADVRYRFQHKPFGDWSPWLDLGGEALQELGRKRAGEVVFGSVAARYERRYGAVKPVADEENEDARRALKSIAATYDQLAHKFIALAQPKPTGEVIKFKL